MKRKQPESDMAFLRRMRQKMSKTKDVSQEVKDKEQKNFDESRTTTDGSTYSANYPQHVTSISKNQEIMCRKLQIQNRTKSMTHRYLNKKGYLVICKRPHINSLGVLIHPEKEVAKKALLRTTYFNGGKAHFPYSEWKNIFKNRAIDHPNDVLMFDNDFAYSSEGVKLFLELDYRSKDRPPSISEILNHVTVCQRVVKRYFKDHDNFKVWVLLSVSKLKYVKTENKPLIATGCHIIFKDIVVTCPQGKQICLSANLELTRKCKVYNLVDDCYKDDLASLRPIYCRKLDKCFSCRNDEDLRLSCHFCVARGYLPSHSIYKPAYLIDSDGTILLADKEINEKISLEKLFEETSIIPKKITMFTPGYEKPIDEPSYLTEKDRSKSKKDKDKTFMYKKDRKYKTQLHRKTKEVTDTTKLEAITSLLGTYHDNYKDTVLASVSESSTSYLVDLQGRGRTFCRIPNSEGMYHNSNRVFFVLNKKRKSIVQHCYDTDCKNYLKSNKDTKARLTMTMHKYYVDKLFPEKNPGKNLYEKYIDSDK